MNYYARKFIRERRRNSGLVRVRDACIWLGLGVALQWAIQWQPPGPRVTHLAQSHSATEGRTIALKGRRIVIASHLGRLGGAPDAGTEACLKTLLRSAGARVISADSADLADARSAPELALRLEWLPVSAPPVPRFQWASGDSVAARAALCLSAGVSAELGLPLRAPVELPPGRHLGGTPPEVLVRLPSGPQGRSMAQPLAEALVRGLVLHFGS